MRSFPLSFYLASASLAKNPQAIRSKRQPRRVDPPPPFPLWSPSTTLLRAVIFILDRGCWRWGDAREGNFNGTQATYTTEAWLVHEGERALAHPATPLLRG